MTLADLRERVDDAEFDAWRARDLYVEPIGDQRLARQAALIAMILANVNRGKHSAWDLDDFDLYRPRQAVTPITRADEEEQFRKQWYARGLVVVQGGKTA